MRADREAAVESSRTVVEQRTRLDGTLRLEVRVHLVREQVRSLEVRDSLVEDRHVAGDHEVPIDHVRQPDAIIGDPGSHAPTRRRMPPVLNVSLDKLACRRPQEVFPGDLALRGQQCDHVLELIAEPVGAAGLVERRPRPHPARERLVSEPAVEHDVHRAVGCAHLDRPLRVVPVARHVTERRLVVGSTSAPDEVDRGRGIVRLAEQHDDLCPRSVGELEAGLERGARIEPRSHCPLEPVSAVQSGGPVRSAVATEELGPIGSPRGLSPAQIEEGHAVAELGVPRVTHQERVGLRVQSRDDPGCTRPTRRTQHPFGVGRHRQTPRAPRAVLDGQHRNLHRVIERHELQQVELNAVVQVLEPAVSSAVVRDVRRFLTADRLGGRAPQLAAVVVADIDRLAHRVADGVVGPRGELVLAAVPRPRIARPGLGDLEPERLVGDHVQPGCWGGLSGAEDGDVLTPVACEATEPVEELQVRAWHGWLARSLLRPERGHGSGDPFGTLEANHLLGETASAAQEHDASSALEERAIVVGELVAAHDVHPAVGWVTVVAQGGLAHPHDCLERIL